MLKTTRAGSASTLLFLPRFVDNPELCLFTTLKVYLERTKVLRGNTKKLFITTTKPYRAASKDSVNRWAKNVLQASGIDTSIFTTHSTRHASTSLAMAKGINIDTIHKSAGWSQNSKVFQRFYNVPFVSDQRQFSQILLENK